MTSVSIGPADHIPTYQVKAAGELVGLPAATLRAWERRYGIATPQRSARRYRLYSEYELRTLRWLKAQTEAGLSIGRAAHRLRQMQAAGLDPARAISPDGGQTVSIEHLASTFTAALFAMHEAAAAEALRQAFNLYPMEAILDDMMRPALVELGEAWHQGGLPIAVEHFASQHCLRQLMGLLSAASPPWREGVLVAGGAPGERHEIGLLMIILRLRQRGWDVRYLGPDLSLDRLAEALLPLRPRLLLFTAHSRETATALAPLPGVLERLSPPRPLVVLGGRGFDPQADRQAMPGVLLHSPPGQAIEAIEALLQGDMETRP
jgi:MerR family transcriptional regulator, light-induced transcriptional regulator